MKIMRKDLLYDGGRMVGVRLLKGTFDALSLESRCNGKSLSETLRIIANRHVEKEGHYSPFLEKLEAIHKTLRDLGFDLATVTKLFLVMSEHASEEEAKEWCKINLRAGK